MNYDPNICSNFAIHTVKLTFGQWDYRAEMIVKVRGNCSGLDVIRAAVNSAYDKLPDKGNGPEIVLKMQSEGITHELTVAEEDDGEEFLYDMLIAAEIIALEPQKKDT